MKNSSFLWQISGYLQELANQIEIAKKEQDWQRVAILTQNVLHVAKRCEKRADECYDKQD